MAVQTYRYWACQYRQHHKELLLTHRLLPMVPSSLHPLPPSPPGNPQSLPRRDCRIRIFSFRMEISSRPLRTEDMARLRTGHPERPDLRYAGDPTSPRDSWSIRNDARLVHWIMPALFRHCSSPRVSTSHRIGRSKGVCSREVAAWSLQGMGSIPPSHHWKLERRSTSEKRRSSLHRCRVKSLRLACGSIRPDRRHPFQPRRRLPRNWNRPSRNGKKTNFRFLPPSSLQGQFRWETRCRRKLIPVS